MRGTLTPDTLARVMRGLAVSRKEGVLHLSNGSVSKRIYFKGGVIIFAGTDDEDERLGEVLIRAGKLKRSDLDLALSVMKETGESLGRTVVEMGFASSTDIAVHALERTKSIICSVFAWPEGQFRFEQRDTSISDEMALTLSPTEMIFDGIRSIEDPVLVRESLGGLKAVLRQPKNPLVPYEEGSLSSSVEWILYQASGVSTIEEILASSPLDHDATLRSIFALVAAGILEVESPEQVIAAKGEGTRIRAPSRESTSPAPLGASFQTTASGGPPQTVGRYQVKKILGRGAMGAVYLAEDPTIGRPVAIKLIQTAVQLSPAELEKYRERFYREAKAAGKLLHPGIVTVFDVGHTDEETPFIVMEYVEGKTLQELVQAGPLAPELAVQLSANILDALDYAHQKGIVHRDIKPGNIVVTADDQPKIMDFGIAHVVGSDFTQAGEVLGSPNYMAPEQLSKKTIDQRTDLFAFGVVLYRMFAGKLPFTGDSFAAIANSVLFEEPADPQSINPAVTPAVSRIVLRCLSKDPAARFASAKELKLALLSSSPDHAVPDADLGLGLSPQASVSKRSTAASERPRRVTRADSQATKATARSSSNNAIGRAVAFVQHEVLRHPKRAAGVGAAFSLVLTAFILAFSARQPATQSGPPDEGATTGAEVAPAAGPTQTDPGIVISENVPNTTAEDTVAGTGEAELYHEASVAFERGELETSKATLEKLLQRNPSFEGAPELLVKVNEQLRNRQQNLEEPGVRPARRTTPDASAPAIGRTAATEPAPSDVDARAFYEARLAFENGDLEGSQSRLQALLRTNPSFTGAAELLVKVNDELWKKGLPMSLQAKHNHRIGNCTGTLALAAWGIRYSSKDHEWKWDFDEIRLMERAGRRVLNLETYETDVLGLGKPKNYKFELQNSMRDEDWARFERLAR